MGVPVHMFTATDLDRYIPIQFLVACAIDLAHSALADLRADFVGAEFCADRDHFNG